MTQNDLDEKRIKHYMVYLVIIHLSNTYPNELCLGKIHYFLVKLRTEPNLIIKI